MIRINLVPREYIEREKKRSTTTMAAAAAALVVAVVGAVTLTLSMKSKALAGQAGSLQNRIVQLEAIALEVDQLESKKQQIDSKNNVVNALLVGRVDYPKIMEIIVQGLPPGQVWFAGMNTSKTMEGYEISLQAIALNIDTVIRWLERLESMPEVTKVSLGAISSSENQVSFPIKFTVVPPN
ncbi:MAG: hypothetical protein HY547_04305 [Elusimicrobia bacterium]|nr:hypothetical protein [Elusimicrobiota bacterium]